jgi:hypothetical protein
MSQSAEYARRVAEFYGALATLDQGAASWDEGYVPLAARRDPEHVEREFERYHSALEGARKRVRQEQIDELLAIQPEWNLIRRAPLGRARFISDVVGRESRVVLLGGAGAGKTTALRYLVAHPPVLRRHPAESGAEGDVLLPIWVQFPLENDLPLPAYLAQDAGQRMSLDLALEFFEQALVRGQALLLIDGLDEIETVEERAKAVRMVESWAEQFPNSRYVVTARPDGYGPPLERGVFAHYVLDPWNEGIEDELGQAWSRALDAWAVEDKTRPFYVERRRLWLHLALAMRQHESRSAPLEEAL